MNTRILLYSPDGPDETISPSSGTSPDEQFATTEQQNAWRGNEEGVTANDLTNAKLDAKSDGGDQANVRGGDSTIMGLGDHGEAGGLSGDGERTDEYDAAVMGLDD